MFILRKRQPGELNWFEAFSCWLDATLNSPLEIKFTYKDAQGPVIPLFDNPDFFDDITRTSLFEPVEDWKNAAIQQYSLALRAFLNGESDTATTDASITPEIAASVQTAMQSIQTTVSDKVLVLEPIN